MQKKTVIDGWEGHSIFVFCLGTFEKMIPTSVLKKQGSKFEAKKDDAGNNGPVCGGHQTATVFILHFGNCLYFRSLTGSGR